MHLHNGLLSVCSPWQAISQMILYTFHTTTIARNTAICNLRFLKARSQSTSLGKESGLQKSLAKEYGRCGVLQGETISPIYLAFWPVLCPAAPIVC